jgi:hypothetical protein
MILLLLCLAIELEPRQADGITGRLRVEIAPEPEGPGLARVWLHLCLQGPQTTQTQVPLLEDPFAAWTNPLRLSSQTAQGDQHLSLLLVQRKAGMAPLPDLTLRVRAGPTAQWHTWRWVEPLGRAIGVAPIEPMPPPEPRGGMGPWMLAGLAVAGLLGWLWWRWPRPALPQPSAYEQALMQMETGDPEAIERGLRQYLAHRWGRPTQALTRPELLAALSDCSPALRDRLDRLLRACEECRFGGSASPPQGEEAARWLGDFEESAKSGKFSESR